MDSALRDLIESYKSGLKTYIEALPSGNLVASEAMTLIANMEKLGEESADYSEFMERAQEKNYFNEVIGFYSKLGAEQYRLKAKTNIIPTPTEMAKAYHLAYESLGEVGKSQEIKSIYERVFFWEKESKTGPEFLTHLEEEDLFLSMSRNHLIKVMESGLTSLLNSGITPDSKKGKDLGVVSSPQMEHYFLSMQTNMKTASSVIELEYNAFAEAENARMSNLWDTTFLFAVFNSILSPLIAFRMTGSDEDRQKTEAAYVFVNDFYGITWDDLFKIARFWDTFERTLYGATKDTLREQNINSALELKDNLKLDLDKCMKGKVLKSDSSKQNCFFRGKDIPLGEVTEYLKEAKL